MSRTVVNVPSGTHLYDDLIIGYSAASPLVELKQGVRDEPVDETGESVLIAKESLPALIAALSEAHLAWKRANSPLYRDPSTVTKGDA